MAAAPEALPTVIRRVRITVRGAVQGVGFRPFVYRLASELALKGWVINSPQGVTVEVQGDRRERLRLLLAAKGWTVCG